MKHRELHRDRETMIDFIMVNDPNCDRERLYRLSSVSLLATFIRVEMDCRALIQKLPLSSATNENSYSSLNTLLHRRPRG